MKNIDFTIKNIIISNNENFNAILVIIFAITVVSLYEFVVYRTVSHRSLYNKSFHISVTIIPYFVGAIIYALQSNVLITLGTIGALAIIRYRTAVKDPVDMLYILWSIFIGITCGCRLFVLCITTSLAVTIVMLIINLLSYKLMSNPIVLVINSEVDVEETVNTILKKSCKKYNQKSRNYTRNSEIAYVYQIETHNKPQIINELDKVAEIKNYSIIEYDNEDII